MMVYFHLQSMIGDDLSKLIAFKSIFSFIITLMVRMIILPMSNFFYEPIIIGRFRGNENPSGFQNT